MLPLVNEIMAMPWALPAVIAIAAFLLGRLLPRRNGSTWVGSLVFFLPSLLLEALDYVHSKKFKYYGLILALLCIEAFFAFRASTVYYDVLTSRMSPPEMMVVCVIVFAAIFLCGYMVATHTKRGRGRWITAIFVVAHDWAGTVWMNYAQGGQISAGSINTSNDGLKVVLTIGMCGLSILPFIMGKWADELRPELEQERNEEIETFTNKATRKIKQRAVERVLRLANRTDIVRLVQALPAQEFTEFKSFVMPIIAPGKRYNLTENDGQATGELAAANRQDVSGATGEMTDENRRNDALTTGELTGENRRNDGQATGELAAANRRIGRRTTDKMTGENRHDVSEATGELARKTRRNDGQATGEMTGEGRRNDGQATGELAAAKPSKTEQRNAKIRAYAEKHPTLTQAKIGAKFGISERTVARAFETREEISREDRSQEIAPAASPEFPSDNGHSPVDPETDKIEVIVIPEEEMALARA